MIRRAVLVAALAAAACATPAHAAAGLAVGIQDERLLGGDAETAAEAVAAWAAAGADVVRMHARWAELAGERPEPGEPVDYDWAALDRAMGLVRAAGLEPMLTVTGPGPLWTSLRPRKGNPRLRPSPTHFARFAADVAARYRDDVDRYLVYNEPNIPGWLEPQNACRHTRGRGGRTRTRCRPLAPHLYRELLAAAVPALRRADPGAEIVVGELAPVGSPARSTRSGVAPLPFLRSMACVDGRYRPLRTRRCRDFEPIEADAIGHHPHGVQSAPDARSRQRGWAKLGDLRRFVRVVDRLTRAGRLARPAGGRLPIHLTEFGYQTSPPDHAVGIPVERQARWNQDAAYIAWSHPRVHSLVHYQWRDEPVRWRGRGSLAYAGWQSGLLYVDGRPKPALEAFRAPLVADTRRRRFWGQVRPGTAHTIRLTQRSADGTFTRVADIETDSRGYWTLATAPEPAAEYRFEWGDGETSPATRAATR